MSSSNTSSLSYVHATDQLLHRWGPSSKLRVILITRDMHWQLYAFRADSDNVVPPDCALQAPGAGRGCVLLFKVWGWHLWGLSVCGWRPEPDALVYGHCLESSLVELVFLVFVVYTVICAFSPLTDAVSSCPTASPSFSRIWIDPRIRSACWFDP